MHILIIYMILNKMEDYIKGHGHVCSFIRIVVNMAEQLGRICFKGGATHQIHDIVDSVPV